MGDGYAAVAAGRGLEVVDKEAGLVALTSVAGLLWLGPGPWRGVPGGGEGRLADATRRTTEAIMITGKKTKNTMAAAAIRGGGVWCERGSELFWQHSECVARLFAQLGTSRRLRDVTKRTQKHKKKVGGEKGWRGQGGTKCRRREASPDWAARCVCSQIYANNRPVGSPSLCTHEHSPGTLSATAQLRRRLRAAAPGPRRATTPRRH